MILVTGATGKVGRHLVAGLLAEGVPVRALTRNPESAGLPDGVEVTSWDPAQPETIALALAGVSATFVNVTAVGGAISELMTAAAWARLSRAARRRCHRTSRRSPGGPPGPLRTGLKSMRPASADGAFPTAPASSADGLIPRSPGQLRWRPHPRQRLPVARCGGWVMAASGPAGPVTARWPGAAAWPGRRPGPGRTMDR